MITTIISDFSRVLLFPTDKTYTGSLNDLHKKLTKENGETYDFFKYFTVNEELFAALKNLSGQYPVYIFTTDTIQERPEIRNMLDIVVSDIFVANNHNIKKNEEEAYHFIASRLQKLPQTFIYIDDVEQNTQAAVKAGMKAIHYQDNKQLFIELQNLHLL
ncbi:HAD-IA family hydrolase [Candidatus Woesebacteria bacterium]|nr:HAD-IA family hydrolase [Candidatus Woesebacteria bacterium]